ncbi:ferredoxin [Clostridium puniceum]|uniref:Ferredoxin n=1 Tax=Clostridium puniceum TaxID=29367 RepID=A0A1S8T7S8_9CLOT|nr:EFR1 family ferrodoxin [Clostridium puniceum]OOM73651.1 ferredoxin [Clostridium puniceum]
MILYFSGTGNSRYTAQVIKKVTSDEVVSINELMKKGNRASFDSKEPFVFIVPTYAWRMPKVVEDFIKNSEFIGSTQAYFILTCGSEIHNAVHYAKKVCDMKKFVFMGCSTVIMPSNYVIMSGVPDEAQASSIIEKALPKIISIGEKIKKHQSLEEEEITTLGKVMSRFVNPLFYMTYVSAKGFYATDECINCKKCVTLCPMNNIKMENSKPKWERNCTHCMACICGCPKKAIEYKNKSKGKPRYYNTGYSC